MNVNNVSLETVCGITSKLPDNSLPEIAFAGKSNVGKSSLINGLINRKSLARTSSQPGKTQTINFYNIEDKLYFVDLPGYGFAKVSKETQAKWGKMIERYLKNSKQLKMISLLVDIRHEPSENDKMMFDWIKAFDLPVLVIATKSDKLSKVEKAKMIKIIKQSLGIKNEPIIPFSAIDKSGKDEIWALIESKLVSETEVIEN
ncbi:MAG: ribosome biogenesis GTP-binding protein YihA/YsxC [Lachnospiraceae bacterium]|nr:ribosome biogenesis GTP-binding protein YihA/YsxC [Lachnospiraceae bacterium]